MSQSKTEEAAHRIYYIYIYFWGGSDSYLETRTAKHCKPPELGRLKYSVKHAFVFPAFWRSGFVSLHMIPLDRLGSTLFEYLKGNQGALAIVLSKGRLREKAPTPPEHSESSAERG